MKYLNDRQSIPNKEVKQQGQPRQVSLPLSPDLATKCDGNGSIDIKGGRGHSYTVANTMKKGGGVNHLPKPISWKRE